jgi:hypothetical protein
VPTCPNFPVPAGFLAFRHNLTVASVARFLAWKVDSKGEETRNLANVRRNLEPMALHFAG